MKTLELPNARKMKKLGFTNHREGFWYLVKGVGEDTTFNLTINRETGGYETDVLNEFFMQPEYYGRMKPVYRDEIIARVNAILHKLAEQGLEIEFDHLEYGVEA